MMPTIWTGNPLARPRSWFALSTVYGTVAGPANDGVIEVSWPNVVSQVTGVAVAGRGVRVRNTGATPRGSGVRTGVIVGVDGASVTAGSRVGRFTWAIGGGAAGVVES